MKDFEMHRAVCAQEMRDIDQRATKEYGIPGVILMENAGRCVADAAEAMWHDKGLSGTIGIFCGSGNNGGDGFVAARHLANRGFAVEVLLVKPPSSLNRDSLLNYSIIKNMRLPIFPFPRKQRYALIIDAVLGIGLSGNITGSARNAVETMNASGTPVLSVDIPSGLDADTGKPLGAAVMAEQTLTMGAPKKGFSNPEASLFTGKVTVAEISLPREMLFP